MSKQKVENSKQNARRQGTQAAEVKKAAVKQGGFGTFSGDRGAKLHKLNNQAGACARLTDLGAMWTGMKLSAEGGRTVDVIPGYDDPVIYEKNPDYLDAIVGWHTNRIAGVGFTLDDGRCQLERNQGENNLHSGPDGRWKRLFHAEVFGEESVVCSSIEKPDGAQGFPGVLSFLVIYGLTEESAVEIHHVEALTAGVTRTVFNPTSRAYSNLTGHDAGEIDTQEVRIHADYFAPTDVVSILAGELREVAGTALDFRQIEPVEWDTRVKGEQLLLGHGYDHNSVIKDYDSLVRLVAEAYDPASGKTLAVYTDRPGFQFHTASWLGEDTPIGGEGTVYRERGGYCFKTQCLPDTLHHPDWV